MMLPVLAFTSLLSAATAATAAPGALMLEVEGMDDCCAEKIASALSTLPFAAGVSTDPARALACVALSGPADEALVRAKLAEAGGYTVKTATPAESCPQMLTPAKRTDPWAGAEGLDVRVVSHGEEVDLRAVAAPGKVTIFDFGAPWCAPCWQVAARLQEVLRARPDLAVRVVELAGADANASFALPVAKQHLQWAEGLPYFVVLSAKGKALYKGSDLDQALAAAEARR